MRHKLFGSLFMVAAISLLALFGCGDKPAPNAPSAAVDQLAPRYEATLAEGIDFKKPGYPNFLAEVSGMSGKEEWGRWTDANIGPVAKFRFKQPLPNKFTLVLKGNTFGPNVGAAVKVRVGAVEQTFVDKDGAVPDTYRLAFDVPNAADTIEIVPPKPTSPKDLDARNNDPRKLGVGMISLQIEK